MEIKLNGTQILLLISVSLSLAICFKIKIDRYKIVRQNPGIKACAVINSGKSDVIGLSVSKDTGKCVGLSRRSAEPHSTSLDDGYAVKVHSATIFQPAHDLANNSHVEWMVPGGLGNGSQLDVIFLLKPTLYENVFGYKPAFEVRLSQKPLKLSEGFGGIAPNETMVLSSSSAFGALTCYIGRDKPTLSVSPVKTNQTAKISFTLQNAIIKILVDNAEHCDRNIRDFGDDFETFNLLYVYMESGLIYRIQFDGNQ
ncbi:uncharacterized protein LOC132756964 [Ruditapes philippinarum]|uniref:uncharacterized protein LOC132756964 n=1 Tax=Ruditapes philippinarum TaxID=129788 RepID=UPI00295B8F8F|nr:uncharacterized protein LOC132756964 [Ruditapes philippinarum]